jgi:hypothetical protein
MEANPIVLSFDGNDDDVTGGVVEHDRVGFHVALTIPPRRAA